MAKSNRRLENWEVDGVAAGPSLAFVIGARSQPGSGVSPSSFARQRRQGDAERRLLGLISGIDHPTAQPTAHPTGWCRGAVAAIPHGQRGSGGADLPTSLHRVEVGR